MNCRQISIINGLLLDILQLTLYGNGQQSPQLMCLLNLLDLLLLQLLCEIQLFHQELILLMLHDGRDQFFLLEKFKLFFFSTTINRKEVFKKNFIHFYSFNYVNH